MSETDGSTVAVEQAAPDYGIEIDADELLAELADDAAAYGEKYEEKRRWWTESLDTPTEFRDARYWMLEARGGQRAYSEAIAELQPGGRYRNADGTVDVRGYLRWLSQLASDAHERSHGSYTKTRQPDEAETAYVSVISTIRNEFGVGWPRLDDVGGNPIPEDQP